MTIDPTLQQALAGFHEWDDLNANTGAGSNPDFPPAGLHDVLVTGYRTATSAFRYKTQDNTQVEIPCPMLTFLYEYDIDANHPDYDAVNPDNNTKSFEGESFMILTSAQIESLPEVEPRPKQQTRVRIMNERLRGHCKVLLGQNSDSIQADITEVLEKLDGDGAFSVQLLSTERLSNKDDPSSFKYQTEFLRELLV